MWLSTSEPSSLTSGFLCSHRDSLVPSVTFHNLQLDTGQALPRSPRRTLGPPSPLPRFCFCHLLTGTLLLFPEHSPPSEPSLAASSVCPWLLTGCSDSQRPCPLARHWVQYPSVGCVGKRHKYIPHHLGRPGLGGPGAAVSRPRWGLAGCLLTPCSVPGAVSGRGLKCWSCPVCPQLGGGARHRAACVSGPHQDLGKPPAPPCHCSSMVVSPLCHACLPGQPSWGQR